MSENAEHRDAKSFGLSRGLLARLVPITLFVGLGSFAVVQSIIGDKQVAEANSDATALVSTEGAPATPLITEKEISDATANQAPAGPISTMKVTTQPQFEKGIGATPPTTPTGKPFTPLPIVKPPTSSVAEMLNNKTPAKDSSSGAAFQGNELPVIQTATPTKLLGDNGTSSQKQFTLNDTNQSSGQPAPVNNGGAPQQPLNLRDPASEKIADSNPTQKPNSIFPSSSPAGTLNPPALNLSAPPAQSFGTPSPPTPGNSGPLKQMPSQVFGDSNIHDTNPKPMDLHAANQKPGPTPFAQSPNNPPSSSFDESKVQNGINLSTREGNRPPGQLPTDNPTTGLSDNQTSPNSNGASANPTEKFASPMRDPAVNVGHPKNTFDNQQQSDDLRRLNDTTTNRQVNASQTSATPGQSNLEGAQVPSVFIEKIAPREIQVDQPAEFKIVVRNVGRVPANDVRVFDEVPNGVDFVSAVPEPTSDGLGGNLEWLLGTIKPGDERTIQLQLRPKQPGEIGSVAQVTFATPASMRTLVTKPQLSIEHSGPEKTMIGDRVPLEIQVRNLGTGAAKKVMLLESIPTQLKYADDFRELEYEIGTLGPGQSRKITLTLAAATAGRFRNTVQVTGEGDLSAQHAIDMEVVAPKLAISSDGPNRRFLKRNASHSFTVQNTGTAISTNLDFIAKLPQGVRFVSADNAGQFDPGSNAVYWSLDRLNIGQAVSVSVTTTPVETGPQDIDFIATADLQLKENLRQPMVVEHLVDLYFEIDDLEDHIEVGSETKYRIRLVNQGTKPAVNVQLSLVCEPGIRPVSSDGDIPGEVRGQEVLFAPVASLNAGEEMVVVVTATGATSGEHRIAANLKSDGREINISKEESTRVYSDR